MEQKSDNDERATNEESDELTFLNSDEFIPTIEEIESLPSVGEALASHLRDAGFDSVEAIRDASIDELTEINRIGDPIAVVLRLAAGATADQLEVDVASLFSDLDDLPGVNVERAEVLRDAGFTTPTDLNEVSVEELTDLQFIDTRTAHTLKRITTLIEQFDSPVVDVDLSDLDREVKARHLRQQERTTVMLFSRLHSELDLGPGTLRFAVQTLKRAIDEGYLKRRSLTETVCASTVIASRATDDPRTLEEVAAVGGIDRGLLARVVPQLTSELGLDVGTGQAEDFVDRYVDDIETARETDDDAVAISSDSVPEPGDADFVDRVRRRARELLDARDDENSGTSYSPTVVAAGAVYGAYLLEGVPVGQQTVADAFDTNCVSIRKHYGRLLEAAGYEGNAHDYQKLAREDSDVIPADAVGD